MSSRRASGSREGLRLGRGFRLAAIVVVASSPGCLERREAAPDDSAVKACATCHGDPERPGDALRRAAPPRDLLGGRTSGYPGVGAHDIHLNASSTHAAIACVECHVVPERTDTPGHADGARPPQIVFGELAKHGDRTPKYDAVGRTCDGSYCHRGADAVWTEPKSSDAACGTCHGLPPAAPHPMSTQCSTCHGAVVDAERHIIAPSLHVNGKVEQGPAPCTACHGSGDQPAPPRDTKGNVLATARGVGAHQAHLSGGQGSRALACTECHVVPRQEDATSHVGGSAATVTLTGVAATKDRVPVWDHAATTCGSTWCHGPDPGSSGTSPPWTSAGPLACDACHGAPPAAPHPQSTQCSACHGAVVDASRTVTARDLHVDGTVQASPGACTACHGASDRGPAPPMDTAGNTSVSSLGVGAHQAHLGGGQSSRALACAECHVVPTQANEFDHVNGGPASVALRGVAETRDHSPAWDRAARTCGSTWCHGPDPGSPGTSPPWTSTGSLACDTCHGAPPAAPHPQSTECSSCHGTVVDASRSIIAPELHVDGTVQTSAGTCTDCHGSGQDPAPPRDTRGYTLKSEMGVGAHQAHLTGGRYGRALACTECHAVPTPAGIPAHADGLPAEVSIQGVGATQGRSPAWDHGDATCGSTWCHAPDPGSARRSPVWTTEPFLGCASCHGAPPPAPHPQVTDCSQCHGAVVAADDITIVDRSRHVDGIVDVAAPSACNTCHGGPVDAAPVPGSPGAAAHRTHLDGTARSRAVPCDTCHAVPATVLAPGHVDSARPAEVAFSGAARANGASPVYAAGTCSGTPCHGAVMPDGELSGGTSTTPKFDVLDGSQAACGSCHGLPPPAPHPLGDLNPVCSACHENIAADNLTFTRPDLHVDGKITFTVP